ncbi:MAG: WbuC family cupin fold metalloprotein [Bacteroidales bacterium]
MIRIDDNILDQTSSKARQTDRKRMNHNFHPQLEDPINRLLNAMEPGTYIQPHKHEDPDRFEVFLALRGRFVVFTFDDEGRIADHVMLDPREGRYGVEIPARTYHSLISLEPGSVAYELKEGPYLPFSAKNFAPWAPAEGDAGVDEYMRNLLEQVGISI